MSENTNKNENTEKHSFFKEALDFCLPIVIALVVAILLKTFVFANAIVPTGSMLNTIQLKDRVIASRLSYVIGDPERFDIIIFEYPDYDPKVNPEEKYFVKRIIGLPGERVDILDGYVYITDKDGVTTQIDDSKYVDDSRRDLYNGSFEVPEDCYFVMGDNRSNSVDSRYWISTNYVSRDKILGKVKFRYYPINTIANLDK